EPVAAERRAEVGRVEYPDVGAADAGRRELGIVGVVLPPVGGRDERPRSARSGEHDVARLVADEQGPEDAGGRGSRIGARAAGKTVARSTTARPGARTAAARAVRAVDDADAVREMVHDPDLAVRARRDRHRLEADGDRRRAGDIPR